MEIRLGQDVSEYWEDEENGVAGVVTNGERLSADVVIGADGVRSTARTLVLVRRIPVSNFFAMEGKSDWMKSSRAMTINLSPRATLYSGLGWTHTLRELTRIL